MIGTQLSLLTPKFIDYHWRDTIGDLVVGLSQTDLVVKIETIWWKDKLGTSWLDGYLIRPQEGLTIRIPIRFHSLPEAKEWVTENYPFCDFDVDSDEDEMGGVGPFN